MVIILERVMVLVINKVVKSVWFVLCVFYLMNKIRLKKKKKMIFLKWGWIIGKVEVVKVRKRKLFVLLFV